MDKMSLKITISFGKKYEDIFHYLKAKENTSKFICGLIRNEMNNDPIEDEFEKKVYKTLLHLIKKENLNLSPNALEVNPLLSNSPFQKDIDLMKDLFG